MGFSLLAPALVHARIGETAATPLLTAFGYAMGFLLVILGKQQLFTENTLTAVLPAFAHPTASKFGRLLRLWSVVFAGNRVGVALSALAMTHPDIANAETREAMLLMGAKPMALTPAEMFSRGIAAGWLIAIRAWLLPAAEHSKVALIVIVTGPTGFGELSHAIVGAAEASFLLFNGATTLGDVVAGFLLPALAGNGVGGSLILALISHAQVRSDAA